MLSGVPNFAFCMGYVNASWTLRADLSSRSVCKLLKHMDAHGYAKAVPTAVAVPADARPIFDLAAGYIRRGADDMPKQGLKAPWRFRQNYLLDAFTTRFGAMDEAMAFLDQAGRVGGGDGATVIRLGHQYLDPEAPLELMTSRGGGGLPAAVIRYERAKGVSRDRL